MGAQDWGSKAPKVQGLTAAATISLDPTLAPIFTWSPNEDETINATSGGNPDENITIIIDTLNTTSRTLTWGTNFRSTGTLATGTTAARRFVLLFKSNGLGWNEISRTTAMA